MGASLASVALLALASVDAKYHTENTMVTVVKLDACTALARVFAAPTLDLSFKRQGPRPAAQLFRVKRVRFQLMYRPRHRVNKHHVLVPLRFDDVQWCGEEIHTAEYKLDPKTYREF